MLDLLDEKGIADKTIVVFFSDNGGSGGADNSPLRGRKAQMWEGGIRVPCLVRWTAGGVPASAVNDSLLSSLELVPSFAAASDHVLPEDLVLDGHNWWPVLRGETESSRSQMFWKRRDQHAARVGDWKWTVMSEKQQGLFNLKEDISESNDLSESHPEKLKELQEAFAAWEAEMEAAEPRGPFRDF